MKVKNKNKKQCKIKKKRRKNLLDTFCIKIIKREPVSHFTKKKNKKKTKKKKNKKTKNKKNKNKKGLIPYLFKLKQKWTDSYFSKSTSLVQIGK